MNYHNELIENGYCVLQQQIDKQDLYKLIYSKFYWDNPNRGHDTSGKYYPKYQPNVEWANYWTAPLNDHPRIANIRKVVDGIVAEFIEYPILYHSDASVITPQSTLVRPHIDTPHRHLPWNNDQRLLGIQVGIPLNEFVPSGRSGTTAFLPGSHKKSWDIKKCYSGDYTFEFLNDFDQPELHYGDMVLWDSRTLHSQMPNITDVNRYLLLMNYLDERIVKDVMNYEASLLS